MQIRLLRFGVLWLWLCFRAMGWNECSFLVRITHECAARVCYYHKKLHEIPYHTVNHWHKVFNPFLPCEFVSVN